MRYTDAEEAWLRENWGRRDVRTVSARFAEAFGRDPGPCALRCKAQRMGLGRQAKTDHVERCRRAERTVRWSREPVMTAWMLENDNGSVPATIEAFEAEFGFRLTRGQVSLFRSSHGTTQRPSHGGGRSPLPIGTVRESKDGFLKVKVRGRASVGQSKDDWEFVHVRAWEQANGRKLPADHNVLFADHDRRNFDPGNLVAVPRRIVAVLNGGPAWHDRGSLEACVALAKLKVGIHEADASRERTCKVCGRRFVVSGKRRAYGKLPSTCPDCLAEGRRWRGEPSPKGTGICKVCGREFTKERGSQVRCRGCIADRPTWSASSQRTRRERSQR